MLVVNLISEYLLTSKQICWDGKGDLRVQAEYAGPDAVPDTRDAMMLRLTNVNAGTFVVCSLHSVTLPCSSL